MNAVIDGTHGHAMVGQGTGRRRNEGSKGENVDQSGRLSAEPLAVGFREIDRNDLTVQNDLSSAERLDRAAECGGL